MISERVDLLSNIEQGSIYVSLKFIFLQIEGAFYPIHLRDRNAYDG